MLPTSGKRCHSNRMIIESKLNELTQQELSNNGSVTTPVSGSDSPLGISQIPVPHKSVTSIAIKQKRPLLTVEQRGVR